MTCKNWPEAHIPSLSGKTVAVTGPTGGLGKPLCRYLACRGAALILLGRDREKTEGLEQALREEFPEAKIRCLPLNLKEMDSVKAACDSLEQLPLDVLIHNAGVYAVPPEICKTGVNQVFQVNFLSPYYMTCRLLPLLEKRRGRVVALGSIAHTYCPSDPENPDLSGRKTHEIYGNSKRYLMFAMGEKMKAHPETSFVIAHPGLAFTPMSNHFSPKLYRLLKWPMKAIYMTPEKSARSILAGVTAQVPYLHWIGPRFFHIWGNPAVEKLRTCQQAERQRMYETAERLRKTL